MELAVATRSFLTFVELDADCELVRFRCIADGRHYGLALPGGCSDRILAISRDDDEFVVYERNDENGTGSRKERAPPFRRVDRFPVADGVDDIHQIAACSEGLYIANSGHNSLDWASLGGGKRHRLCFDGHGSWHINSVFPCGSDLAAVLFHNKSRGYSEIGWTRRSCEGLDLLHRVTLWDTGCHNVYIDDEILAYNASEVGDFVVVDLATGRIRRRIHFPGHTKGLSVTRDRFVIGVSEYASRWARNTSRGRLAVIDRNSLRVLGRVDLNAPTLPHPIGNVNEIRCLSETELGHAAPTPPPVALDELTFDPGSPSEQLRLHLRRAAIETLKSAKTAYISVREGMRRALNNGGIPSR